MRTLHILLNHPWQGPLAQMHRLYTAQLQEIPGQNHSMNGSPWNFSMLPLLSLLPAALNPAVWTPDLGHSDANGHLQDAELSCAHTFIT